MKPVEKMNQEETYYEILKVDKKATVSEIVQAYHHAKSAFSRDSLATYSLFSPEDAKAELDKLEKAYLHLSNIDRKREYDRALSTGTPLKEKESPHPAQPAPLDMAKTTEFPAPRTSASHLTVAPSPAPVEGPVNGLLLKEAREQRNLSIDDVARVTKIPVKFIRAIESQDPEAMPARVYVQGFIRNLATIYRMDPTSTAKGYLHTLDGEKRPNNVK